jgi:hypothetical protein
MDALLIALLVLVAFGPKHLGPAFYGGYMLGLE